MSKCAACPSAVRAQEHAERARTWEVSWRYAGGVDQLSREGLTEEVTMSEDLEEVRAQARRTNPGKSIPGGRKEAGTKPGGQSIWVLLQITVRPD